MFFQEKQAVFYDDRGWPWKSPIVIVDYWRVYDLRMGVATFLKLEHWKTQDVVGDDRF